MKQTVKFEYETAEIECKVEWTEDGRDYDVNFFDPHTGYTGKSSPAAAQGNWWYQDDEEQEKMRSLIEAVSQWGNEQDWCELLTWEDGGENIFEFEWDGKTRSGYDGEYRELARK